MRSMGAPKGVVDIVESAYAGAEARMQGTSCQSWVKTPIGAARNEVKPLELKCHSHSFHKCFACNLSNFQSLHPI